MFPPYATAYREFFESCTSGLTLRGQLGGDCDTLQPWSRSSTASAYALDHFSEYGIVPFTTSSADAIPVDGFRSTPERILRLSTEMGHHHGDAHVPLHTTENYNGRIR